MHGPLPIGKMWKYTDLRVLEDRTCWEDPMDAARIELKLTLDEAGLSNPTLQTFSQRLNVQKRLYLVQVLGYDLGYRFSWYLRGPYCSSLTQEAFALRDDLLSGDNDADGFMLSDDAKETIRKAKELWRVPNGVTIDQDEWLELLASLHYLKEVAYWPEGADKSFDAVFDKLIEAKPRFSDQILVTRRAWQQLNEFQLLAAA